MGTVTPPIIYSRPKGKYVRVFPVKGKIEKYIVIKYKNTAPKNSVVDYYKYDDCYNGRVLCQDILDADSNLILRTNNTYNIKLENHYAINMWHDHETILGSSTGASYSGANIPTTKIWRYPYILSRIELVSDTTKEYCQDGKNILRTKKYFYNPNNHQVSQIDENTSLCGQIKRTKFRYSVDEVDNISCKAMVQSYHKLNDIVQTKNTLVENGQEKCLSTKYVTYIPNGLPESTSTSIGDYPLEKREEYIYDGMSNVRSVKLDGVETVYIWSYNGQYPIAKIEGVTLNDVIETMAETKRSQYSVQASVTDIGNNALSEIMGEKDPDKILGYINTIREKIAKIGGHVSTYTYKSLIGITSQTLPNGLKTTYEYDGFGRLIQILDHNGKVISKNEYNYKK